MCTTWECRCLGKHSGGERVEKSRFKQPLFPHREEAQEECLHGHVASHSHCDLRDAFFIHVDVQSLAKKRTL